jgi:hypothetical protein
MVPPFGQPIALVMGRYPKDEAPGATGEVKPTALSEKEKPALDEETFQQLLSAAYVLQEHQDQQERRQREESEPSRTSQSELLTRPAPNAAGTLSEIADLQDLLGSQLFDVQASANLVAERLLRVTAASGVAIALVRQDQLEFCTAAGSCSQLAGTSLPMSASLFEEADRLPLSARAPIISELHAQTGSQNIEFTSDGSGKSSIAIPLRHEGNLSGLIEVRFDDAGDIDDHDIRACQLLAGLMTEAIARAAELQWKQVLSDEQAAMLETLERLRPQLERLAREPSDHPAEMDAAPAAPLPVVPSKTETPEPQAMNSIPVARSVEPPPSAVIPCRECGSPVGEAAMFCGQCGAPRSIEVGAGGDMQSKWASLWRMQQEAERKKITAEPEIDDEPDEIVQEEEPIVLSITEAPVTPVDDRESEAEEVTALALTDASHSIVIESPSTALQIPEKPPQSLWASATDARQWLESMQPDSPARRWMRERRGNIWLGVSLFVLLVVIFTGSTAPPAYSTKYPQPPPLTLFERILVAAGLAEPPEAPVYTGNPNTQVWVDLHTALYYCPGSDLYGKTPGGKYTTQRDAQLDQFEPAARKSCD